MFFVLSTGRSGTTTIAKTLSQIDGCFAVHEPSPELIVESIEYRYGDFSKKELKEILLETRNPEVEGSTYCESNQVLSLIIPVLKETYPQARYIWLIRNGLDVVASTMQKQWYTGHSENHDKYENCTDIEKKWIDGRIRGDKCGDMSETDWNNLDRFAKCCWYWGYVNRLIERDLNTCGKDLFYFLRLEEIDQNLQTLVNWMGLDSSFLPKVGRSNVAKRPIYHWTTWTGNERQSFENFCSELMDKYYPSWRTPEGRWQGIVTQQDGSFLERVKNKTNLYTLTKSFLKRTKSK